MSRQERTGLRDLSFSRWHRSLPNRCSALDIDLVEYCGICSAPLALIETTAGVGFKPTTVLRALAARAGLPAYLVQVHIDEAAQIGSPGRILSCRLEQVYPSRSVLANELANVADLITALHDDHARSRHP